MDWALVIHEVPDLAEMICGGLATGLGIPAHSAANLAEAGHILKFQGSAGCKLIVASFSAPANADVSSPVDRVEPDAVAFLRKERGERDDDLPACIFLVTTTDPSHLDLVRGLKNVELLGLKLAFSRLCEVAGRLAWGQPKTRRTPLDINITLTGNVGHWHLHNKERDIDRVGVLKISPVDLETMLLDSSMVGAMKPGETQTMTRLLRRLGVQLYKSLAGNSIDSEKLGEHIFEATECLTLLEHTRLRFDVDADTSALIVEALAHPGSGPEDAADLWMLKLPIFRKFGGEGGRKPLFKDGASRHTPVKCLLIEGETRAFSAGGDVAKRFADLPGARTEIDWLKGYLERNQAKYCLAPPTLLRAADYAPGQFAQVLKATLESDAWQLIHYSGHSEPGPDKKAWLVLGPRANDLFDVDLLARCPQVQFVFLNSCSSANANFIQRLAERNVPAVAGYAWPIPDQVAAVFSKQFYISLFPEHEGQGTQRFLEFAFMRAKAALYANYKGESLWTAPLLFMQTLDREEDARPTVATGAIP